MKENYKEIIKQHFNNYRAAIIDTIEDNSKLFIEDVLPLFQEPPLSSMDQLKSKILEEAKRKKMVLPYEQIDTIVQEFRTDMVKEVTSVGTFRKEQYKKWAEDIKEDTSLTREEMQIFCGKVQNEVDNLFKERLKTSIDNDLSKIEKVVDNTSRQEESMEMCKDLTNFFSGRYSDNLMKSFHSKLVLKDQTLSSRLIEHDERYRFTKEHSHLLQGSKTYQNKKVN